MALTSAACMVLNVWCGYIQVARNEPSEEMAHWIAADLQRVIAEEREWRLRLWAQGLYSALPLWVQHELGLCMLSMH